MAASFKIVGQREDVEFLGGTRTRNVVSVSAVSQPSGIYYEFRIPRNLYVASAVDAGALSYAAIYEGIAAHPFVVGVEWGQVPTPAGELADQVTVTVSSTSGDSTASVASLLNRVGPDLMGNAIAALHSELDATEAL